MAYHTLSYYGFLVIEKDYANMPRIYMHKSGNLSTEHIHPYELYIIL